MDVRLNQSTAASVPDRERISRAPAGNQSAGPDRTSGSRTPANPVASVIVRQEFPQNTRLRVDEASNRIVAQILDENNEVVRQVPPQELLDISARFNRLEGILFDEQR